MNELDKNGIFTYVSMERVNPTPEEQDEDM